MARLSNWKYARGVRSGANSDVGVCPSHVRFSFNSGHSIEGSAQLRGLSQVRLVRRADGTVLCPQSPTLRANGEELAEFWEWVSVMGAFIQFGTTI